MPAPTDILVALVMATTMGSAVAQAPAWPTPADIQRARERSPFPTERRIASEPIPHPPGIELRRPEIDIEALLRPHAQPGTQAPKTPLRIFVTLDMPRGSLQRLAEQSARSGAVLVLRGLKNDSMRATLAAIQAMNGDQPGAWLIDPEAFTRYDVTQAPSFVLTLPGAAGSATLPCTSQCADAPPYLKVSGDVSLDYALETLQHRHPSARATIAPLLQRLRTRP